MLRPLQQLRQLGDASRDFSRLILRLQRRCRAPTRLRFEVDMRYGKAVSVGDDVGDVRGGVKGWVSVVHRTSFIIEFFITYCFC